MTLNDQTPRSAVPGLAPEGVPIVALSALASGAAALAARRWALLPLAFTLGSGYFFRDPERELPTDESKLYSAADGRVIRVEYTQEPRFIRGGALRIATFLSLFDVHINRAATGGVVRYAEHVPGDFTAAWAEDADVTNERMYIGFDTPHGPVMIVQIAGLVARRIVCRVRPGDEVATGARIGLIKFGSRTDVIVPADAADPLVVAGARIQGGVTPIAAWRTG